MIVLRASGTVPVIRAVQVQHHAHHPPDTSSICMKPTILIVTPALAGANNGNWQTARRWAGFLESRYHIDIADHWHGLAADMLIALHARRSGEAVEAWAAAHPRRPIALVLTGTDAYRDIHRDPVAIAALGSATRIVTLQPQAVFEVDPSIRDKVEVIFQSAPFEARLQPRGDGFEVVAIGHLRHEKDPLTLVQAARLLPKDSALRIVQVGRALDAGLEQAAREARSRRYEWIGELPHHACRKLLRRARALVVTSRIEGGANVIVESVMSDVRVVASRISGNIGMLGEDYDGYFTPGDAQALADLLLRVERDRRFRLHLKEQCRARRPLFEPEREREAVLALVARLLEHR